MKLDLHLFDWPSRHNVHLTLPLMLVLSFLLHAACAAVFQVAYPRSKASPERSATVYFLQPGTPEAAQMAPLLAASDPALFSPGQLFGRDGWKLPETVYVASFDSEKPALSPLPVPASASVLPAVLSTGPVVGKQQHVGSKTVDRAPGAPTVLKLSGELSGRTVTPPAEFHFSAPPKQGLIPAEFLIAVSPDGFPLHLFPQTSSGNEKLDRAALSYLAAARFSRDASQSEPVWGTATFLWGADVERKKAP
ncbi:MAG: hypothetical protein ACOYMS_03940 [Terrimicrobiaceae bacterium]